MLLFIHQSFFFHIATREHLAANHKAKKNKVVFLLPFEHKTVEVYKREEKKPKAILDYNNDKSGIDTADEMLQSYSIKAFSRSDGLWQHSSICWILCH